MADDTQAEVQQDIPVNETQEPAMPTGEQQIVEPAASTQEVQDGLPENASDRTRHEFDKLQSQLREERSRRETVEAAFRSMQPKEQPAQGLAPIVDPDTGYINDSAVAERDRLTQEALSRAQKAEEAVQSYMQDQENRVAYQAHPESDPSSKQFDPELKKRAAAILLHSMVNPQEYSGKQLSLKEAYDYLKGSTSSAVEVARKQGAQEAIEQLSPKEQAALEATGAPSRREDVVSSLDTLRFQTRKGNQDAIVARMKALKSQT